MPVIELVEAETLTLTWAEIVQQKRLNGRWTEPAAIAWKSEASGWKGWQVGRRTTVATLAVAVDPALLAPMKVFAL